QSAIAVEEVLYVRGRHAFFGDQVEHDARVDLARPGSHRQPVERSKTHRTLDAAPLLERAHRSAAAEMGHDHTAAGELGCDLAQGLCDVLVRQAVKPVAPDP